MMSLYNDYKEYENKLFYHNAFIDAINNLSLIAYPTQEEHLLETIQAA